MSNIAGMFNTLAKAIADQRRELIERIDAVQTPTAELVEAVRVAVQSRVMEEATACVQREMRLLENVLLMKMREAIACTVDSLLEGRAAELEDALENKVNEVIEVKMALMPTTAEEPKRKTAATRKAKEATHQSSSLTSMPNDPSSCDNSLNA